MMTFMSMIMHAEHAGTELICCGVPTSVCISERLLLAFTVYCSTSPRLANCAVTRHARLLLALLHLLGCEEAGRTSRA